jgi:hypothetical protein
MATHEEDRERASMDYDLETPEDPLLRQEESAAAAEAGSIGGREPEYEGDEADRPLEEAGEGEAEGFEVAERDLGETASHGDNRYSPEADEIPLDEESEGVDPVYGEPDEVDPTEVVRDPREGADDPGSGTPLAPDR